jgi:methyl-accepting chemotaxis protein
MQNIGFIEKSDINDKDRIKFLVDSAKGISTIKINKEVNLMTEDTPVVPEAEVAAETPVVENVEVAPEATAEVVAEAEAVVAEAATEPAIAKSDEVANSTPTVVEDRVDAVTEINKNVTDIKDSLTNALSNLTQTIKSVQDSIAVITKSLEEVTGKVNSVTSEVKEVKGSFDEFGKRVDAVEADTAFRKSGDLGEIVQEFSNMKTHKSLWGGRFLTNADLFN